MTTFVPLAPDAEGTASAVAAGDWLLQIITKHDRARTQSYYTQFLDQFEQDPDTGEQRIRDHTQLFELLLSQHQLVFDYAVSARQQQEQQMQTAGAAAATGTAAAAGGSTGAATSGSTADKKDQPLVNGNAGAGGSNKKSYAEVLREVEDFFSLLMAMVVLRMVDAEKAGHAAGTLCAVFRSSHDMPEFRLRLLEALYNAFPPEFPYRFPIFVAILEYAAETKLFANMLPYIKYINDWMDDWKLAAVSKRQVYLILANELKKLGKADEAYSYLKRHVQLLQGEPDEVLASGATVAAAVELVEDSIKLAEVVLFDDIIELSAVRFLEYTPHAALLDLLRIFVSKGPQELDAFNQQHPTLLEEHGLNYEACMGKIRLLAIASLVRGKKKITSLKAIAEKLQVTEADAEEAAVQAIGQGIIDAKIDQMGRVLLVKSAMQREFGRAEWEDLYEHLEHWQEGVKSLMSCIKSVKQQVSAAAAAAQVAAALPAASSPATAASGDSRPSNSSATALDNMLQQSCH